MCHSHQITVTNHINYHAMKWQMMVLWDTKIPLYLHFQMTTLWIIKLSTSILTISQPWLTKSMKLMHHLCHHHTSLIFHWKRWCSQPFLIKMYMMTFIACQIGTFEFSCIGVLAPSFKKIADDPESTVLSKINNW